MYIAGRRLVQLAVVIVVVVAIVAVAAFNYDDIVKYINPPPQTPPPPVPFQPIVIQSNFTGTPSMPASIREEVLSIAMSDRIVKEALKRREYSISGVLPSTNERGDIVGGCALVSFPNPVWLEFNVSELDEGPLEYMGWVKQLIVCVDLSSKKVVGINPSLGIRNVPSQLPESMSSRARSVMEKVLGVARKFLLEKYGLREDEVNLTFYGVRNGVAIVVATPRTGDKLHRVEILMKIDAKNMEVIEAYKYVPHEIYINPKYVNITRKG